MQPEFRANVAETGWLIAGLYLASAIAQPTMGRLSDLYGPRRIYSFSLILIAIAGFLGAIVPNLAGLVFVRVLLGSEHPRLSVRHAHLRVQADRLGCEPPRTAMGVLSMCALSMSAVGPFVGGVLTSVFGWHSIFTVNIPLALITLLLVFLWVPKDEQSRESMGPLMEEVDLVGIGLFAASLSSLMIFLLNLNHPIWLASVAAVILCGASWCTPYGAGSPLSTCGCLLETAHWCGLTFEQGWC